MRVRLWVGEQALLLRMCGGWSNACASVGWWAGTLIKNVRGGWSNVRASMGWWQALLLRMSER